jgi:hypothetical protein
LVCVLEKEKDIWGETDEIQVWPISSLKVL